MGLKRVETFSLAAVLLSGLAGCVELPGEDVPLHQEVAVGFCKCPLLIPTCARCSRGCSFKSFEESSFSPEDCALHHIRRADGLQLTDLSSGLQQLFGPDSDTRSCLPPDTQTAHTFGLKVVLPHRVR